MTRIVAETDVRQLYEIAVCDDDMPSMLKLNDVIFKYTGHLACHFTLDYGYLARQARSPRRGPTLWFVDIMNGEHDAAGLRISKLIQELGRPHDYVVHITRFPRLVSDSPQAQMNCLATIPKHSKTLEADIKAAIDRVEELIWQESIVVHLEDMRFHLPTSNITHVSRIPRSRWLKVIALDGSTYTISDTLEGFMEKVNSPYFVRVSKTHVVNTRSLDCYDPILGILCFPMGPVCKYAKHGPYAFNPSHLPTFQELYIIG